MANDYKSILEEEGYTEEEVDYMWRVISRENKKVVLLINNGVDWRKQTKLIHETIEEYHKRHKDDELLL